MRVPSIRPAILDINMTPMIDMVFLLIVYFVWTSNMQANERVLPSQLSPLQGTARSDADLPPPPEMDFEPIVIRVVASGNDFAWTLNDVHLPSVDRLRAELLRLAKIQRQSIVIVHPDPEVPLGRVIDAYDAARSAGFEKLQFTASQASGRAES